MSIVNEFLEKLMRNTKNYNNSNYTYQPKEEWRKCYRIPGMEVSNKGKVRRRANFQSEEDYFHKIPYYLKPVMKDGNLIVRTMDYGDLRVDELVETCFHGSIGVYHEVVHIDGDPSNCKVNNLRKMIKPECYDENGILLPHVMTELQREEEFKSMYKERKKNKS